MEWQFIAVIIILIIIIVYFVFSTKCKLTKGFWVASEDYCAEAKLKFWLMYIGDSSGFCKFDGYLLAANDNGVIMNSPVNIEISVNLASVVAGDVVCGDVKFVANDSSDELCIPDELQFKADLVNGRIVMSSNEIVYCDLYKDAELSFTTADQN